MMKFRMPGPCSPNWVIAESIAAAALSLVSMLAIGRVIGPHASGLGTTVIAAFLLLDICSSALFHDVMVQRRDLKCRHSHSAATAGMLLACLEGMLLAGLGPFLVSGPDKATVAAMCLALAPLLPFSSYSGTTSGLLLRQFRFRLLAQRLLVGQPLALAAGLVAARYGYGPWAMVIAQAVATLVTFGLMTCCSGVSFRPALDVAALRDLWPVAGPQVASYLVSFGKSRVFVLSLGHLLLPTALGLANMAFRLTDAALSLVMQAITRISMPRLCALQADHHGLAEAYGDLVQLQSLIGFPICAGVALTAPDIVVALLGPDWAAAGAATQVVAVAGMVPCAVGDYGSLFVATNKAGRNFTISAAALALPLGVLVALRPETPEGAALAWGAQSVVLPLTMVFVVLRELDRSLQWLIGRLLPAAIATAAMVAAVLLVQNAFDMPPMLRLAASVAAAIPTFAGVAVWGLGGMPRALARKPAPAA